MGFEESMNFLGLCRSILSPCSSVWLLATSGVRRRGTGCKIFESLSRVIFWKSKLTGLGPGEEMELVGLSTNFVHSFAVSLVCGDRMGSVSGLTDTGVSFPGINVGGRTSGSSMWFLRNTTRCMAVLNSCRDRAPSLVTSASCHIFLSSWTGRRDFSKNILATGPASKALVSGWRDLN